VKREILWDPAAEVEVDEAFDYYSKRSRRAAEGFRARLLEAVDRIAEHGEAFPVFDERGNRRCLVERYPFGVLFELRGQPQTAPTAWAGPRTSHPGLFCADPQRMKAPETMLGCTTMTKVDHIVEAAMALSDDEKRQAADRILKAVPTYDPELEASLARGLADLRAGRVIDADDVIAELEAADRADEAAGL